MKKNTYLLLLCSIICLTGCTTIRTARHVQEATLQEIPMGERTPTSEELGLAKDKPVTLEGLEQIALVINPSIRQAIHAVRLAELAIRTQEAGYLPTLGMSASHSRATNNNNRHHTGFSHAGNWNGTLNLDFIIYDFGKTEASVKQAVEQYNAALQNLRSAESNVIYAVRTAYFSLLRAVELQKVSQETVLQYKEHLDHIQIKNEVGSGTPFDLTKAQVDYNNAILKANNADNTVRIAWTALIRSIGLAEDISFPLEAASLKEYDLTCSTLMALARQSEPGLAALLASEKAASIYVDRTVRDLYPTFSLNLGGSVSGRSPAFPLLWNLSGAASLSETLYSGGRKLNAISAAVLQLQTARAAVAAYEQTLYQKLRTAALNAELAQKQLQVAKLTEKQAQEYFDIVNEQYNVGKASSLERTDAQVSLSSAKANTISAIYDYQDALAIIAQLTGDFQDMQYDEISPSADAAE